MVDLERLVAIKEKPEAKTVPKGVTNVETIEAPEDQFGDQHLPHHTARTQITGEPPQEFTTALEKLTHCALPALHKDHVHRGAGKASSTVQENKA
jgi:hypothetical protein